MNKTTVETVETTEVVAPKAKTSKTVKTVKESKSTKGEKQMTTLEAKIADRILAKEKAKAAQAELLASNDVYVDYLTDKKIENNNVVRLDAIINQINAMKAIVAQDGTKYAIHCYPVAESIFGPVGSRLLAIAQISGAMFTAERQAEFTALTGIDYLIALDASHQLGRPAYVTKAGDYVEEFIYSADKYAVALTAVAHSLGLDVVYANQVTTEELDKWFKSSKSKALAKVDAQKKSDAIDDEPFTLEQ